MFVELQRKVSSDIELARPPNNKNTCFYKERINNKFYLTGFLISTADSGMKICNLTVLSLNCFLSTAKFKLNYNNCFEDYNKV